MKILLIIQTNRIQKAIWNEKDDLYQIQLVKRIDLIDREITFHYNSHSNFDLFIHDGFVFPSNQCNSLSIGDQLRKILSQEDISRSESANYFTSSNIYSTSDPICWTILKSIDLILRKDFWCPDDDPPEDFHQIVQHNFILLKNSFS